MTSASSEKAIRERNRQIESDKQLTADVIRVLMSTVNGRRWVWLNLADCAVFRIDSGLDAMQMAFDKGVRNIGLKLLADVTRTTPDLYITMTRENTRVQLKDTPDDDGTDTES